MTEMFPMLSKTQSEVLRLLSQEFGSASGTLLDFLQNDATVQNDTASAIAQQTVPQVSTSDNADISRVLQTIPQVSTCDSAELTRILQHPSFAGLTDIQKSSVWGLARLSSCQLGFNLSQPGSLLGLGNVPIEVQPPSEHLLALPSIPALALGAFNVPALSSVAAAASTIDQWTELQRACKGLHELQSKPPPLPLVTAPNHTNSAASRAVGDVVKHEELEERDDCDDDETPFATFIPDEERGKEDPATASKASGAAKHARHNEEPETSAGNCSAEDAAPHKSKGGRKRAPEIDWASVTDPEERRKLRRMAKNRRTAAASRERKRAVIEGLQGEVDVLKKENESLRLGKEELQTQLTKMEYINAQQDRELEAMRQMLRQSLQHVCRTTMPVQLGVQLQQNLQSLQQSQQHSKGVDNK